MNINKQNEFDIYEYIYIFKKYIKIFFLILGTTVLSTFFYSILQTPVYKTCAKVRIEEDYNRLTNASTLMFLGKQKTFETEIEMMKNYSFAEKVVQKLIAKDIIKNTIKEKKIFFKDIEKDKNKIYQSIEKLPFEKNIKYCIKNNVDNLLGEKEFLSNIYETSINPLFLKKDKNHLNYSLLVTQIFNNISIYPLEKTNIVVIESQGNSPDKVKNIVDTYAQNFIIESNRYKKIEARSTRDFLSEQLVLVKNNLEKTEKDLKLFKQTKGIFSIDAEFNNITLRIGSLKTNKLEIELKIYELEKQISLIKDSFSLLQNKTISFDISLINEYKSELIALEIERIKSLETFTSSHQKIKKIDEQIFLIKEKINEEIKKIIKNEKLETVSYDKLNLINELSKLESEKISFQSKEKALNNVINKIEKEIYNLSESELELGKLIREQRVNEQIYTMLLTKYENAKLVENIESGNISIIQFGILPYKPISPNIVKNMIVSIFLGILIGIIILLFLQNFNQTIESNDDIERYLKLSVIGYIPKIKIKKLKSFKEQLVSSFDSTSIVSESYKSLKLNMQFTNVDKKNKIILITSPSPGDGKTTTIVNLAITMAELGEKTLLIDCDLRKPIIHHIFELKKDPGLTNFIINDEIKTNQIIHDTFIKNLYVIPSGDIPPNPSVILNSQKLDKFLSEIKNDFTNILFDAPPAIMADTSILGNKVDVCFLVVSAGKTTKKNCLHTIEMIKKVRLNIIGVVLNNVDMQQYPYHYRYYYEEGKKK